jgi:GNAT superfamily N-acetyltransferase
MRQVSVRLVRVVPPRKRPAARPKQRPPATELRLRPAVRGDLPLLVRHRRRMWREIGRWSEADLDRADRAYRTWVLREMAGRRFVAFIIEGPRGKATGSGAMWLAPSQPRPGRLAGEKMPYIMSMFTEPAFRGRGVATRLVRALVEWAAEHGYARVVLHASKKGRPVYERLGFENGREMRLDLTRPSRAS